MKPALLVLTVLCLLAVATEGQKEKRRSFPEPFGYYSAEKFLDLNETDRAFYVMGLMDGFYASALFGAPDDAVAKLTSCAKDMDTKQVVAIIMKYVKDHPESWHLPLSVEAYNALSAACPGGLVPPR